MINLETNEEREMVLSLSEREELLASGKYKQKLSTAKFIAGHGDVARRQAGSGWSDVLGKISKGSPRNNMNS